jgi:Putative adhesin
VEQTSLSERRYLCGQNEPLTEELAMNLQTARGGLIAAGLLAMAVPVWAGSQIAKTLKLDPGGRFVLEADEGSVDVMGGDQAGASVVVMSDSSDFQDRVDFSFEEDPGMVRIRARRRYWNLLDFLFDPLWLHYEIRVPKLTTLEIRTGGGGIRVYSMAGDEDLKTSGGSIEVSHLVGGVRAHTSGGHIRVEQIQGEVEVGTSGGGIEADSIDGALTAATSGGPIEINGITGRVEAHTSGGSIAAVFSRGNSRGGVLETSGGSIDAKIDPAANLDVDASTSGGGVVSDVPIREVGSFSRNAVRGTLGSGGNLLRLHTSGGSVRLESERE